ncbi:hypothetical protein [Burkholderia diffusa]|uniref:hypothetical protein n=1 Tax=Burkholderia diffusa TaxID=488732 RepID=UPI00158C1CFC|nr:hypothetical protein [Burkholderia diffusa]
MQTYRPIQDLLGELDLLNLVRFTEPSNAMVSTVSEVAYTFSPVDVADWANLLMSNRSILAWHRNSPITRRVARC